MAKAAKQKFGGTWTEDKLKVLSKYLNAYTQALKNQPFKLIYIDAFAGTGYRETTDSRDDQQLIFDALGKEEQQFLSGSAKISLDIKRPFDRYLFIEQDTKKCEQLCELASHYTLLKDQIFCSNDDCNTILTDFCNSYPWKKWRAVLFLDPFGMNVKWDTMKAIADTQAIDVWVLFPLGSAVNRLLMRDGDKIPDSWKNKLNDIFGTEEWFGRFYERTVKEDLFEQIEQTQKTGNLKAIADFTLNGYLLFFLLLPIIIDLCTIRVRIHCLCFVSRWEIHQKRLRR
ncbi:MAG: three-Cys-motif partner protein TcmP [Verrucomicrobiae bacterium]|nr:three-Cys-motif partner protein TcmP [Verrucomicrobiae bacterium]